MTACHFSMPLMKTFLKVCRNQQKTSRKQAKLPMILCRDPNMQQQPQKIPRSRDQAGQADPLRDPRGREAYLPRDLRQWTHQPCQVGQVCGLPIGPLMRPSVTDVAQAGRRGRENRVPHIPSANGVRACQSGCACISQSGCA